MKILRITLSPTLSPYTVKCDVPPPMLGTTLRDNVGDNVRDNVGDNVRDNVRDNVGDNVRDNVGDNVKGQRWGQR